MIRGIHYFSAEVKPKSMSSQGAALNMSMASQHLSVHTMSIYVIHRTNYAHHAVHILFYIIYITMTNKSARFQIMSIKHLSISKYHDCGGSLYPVPKSPL